MVGPEAGRHHGSSVPVWLESTRGAGTNVPTRRLRPPASMDKTSRQRIRYLRTVDGVQLAWAEAGQGPLLIKASNWLTHLEYDWESPVWRHWLRFFADHFRFVRSDERGCGMTDWSVGDLSPARWVQDLEAVADTAPPRAPMILVGISQGAALCLDYAVRQPHRVPHLVLSGAYARAVA